MKIKNLFSFLAVSTALTFTSCSKNALKTEEAAKNLAAGTNTSVVISVKIKDLLDKGGISNKENVPMAAQILFSDKVEYFTNPEKAGVDLSGKSYIGVVVEGDKHLVWAISKIKDKETFEKTMKEEGQNRFEEVEGYTTVSEDDKMITGWNKNHLVMLVSPNGKVKEKFKSYLELMENNEKTAHDHLNKFFDTNTDLAIYTDMGQAAGLQASMPHEMRGGMQDEEMIKKMAEKLKGSYGLLTINFENDKIVAEVSNHLTETAKKEFDFLSNSGFPKEHLAQLGSDQLTGFISVNGNPKKTLDWAMQMSGDKGLMDEMREKSGLDIDKLLGSFKGNLLFAFQGFIKAPFATYNEDGKAITDSLTLPRMSVITTLEGDYVQKTVDSILREKKEENYYALDKSMNPQYLAFKPGVLFFTNDKNTINGTGTPQLDGKAAEVLSKPFAFYFDLKALVSQAANGNEIAIKIADKLKYAAGGMDMTGGRAELILENGGKNALWTIINLGVESSVGAMPEM